MGAFRHLLLRHRALAIALLLAALAVKALVPAGYMLSASGRLLTVELCIGLPDQHRTVQIAIPGQDAPADDESGHRQASALCPYSALSMGALASIDGVLLALAFAFVLTLGRAPSPPPQRQRRVQLRPPLRGPPVLA
jgi:hypothetical protein